MKCCCLAVKLLYYFSTADFSVCSEILSSLLVKLTACVEVINARYSTSTRQ